MRWFHLVLALLIGLAFTLESPAGGGRGAGRGTMGTVKTFTAAKDTTPATIVVSVPARTKGDGTEVPAAEFTFSITDKTTVTKGGGFGPDAPKPDTIDKAKYGDELKEKVRVAVSPVGKAGETIEATTIRILPPGGRGRRGGGGGGAGG